MKKLLTIAGIGVLVIIVITAISMIFSGEAQNSFQEGFEAGKSDVQQIGE